MNWPSREKTEGVPSNRREALAYIPVKPETVQETRLADGLVRLAYPVPISPWLVRTARLLGRSSATHQIKKTELDRLGTAVWDLMNGKRTVGRIIKNLAQEHQLLHREAEVAVTQFIRELGRRGLIGLK